MHDFDKSIDGQRPRPLKQWLWKSYFSAALIPLLMIEIGFLAIYWGTSEFVFKKGAEAVTGLATHALTEASQREAETISARLQTMAALTEVFAAETQRALATPTEVGPEVTERYAMSADGVFHTLRDTGGAAVYYSGIVPVGAAEIDKVWRTERLDPLMASLVKSDPLIQQVYVNTFDSMNRIYPYVDVIQTYPPKMEIPSYNFYYEADPEHNPEGKVVWTDAYIDPAGAGWMVSSIAPVMGPERLEAVVGIDVTIGSIVAEVLDIEVEGDGYAMLVGRDGTLLALPPRAEADLGLTELIGHSYEHAILEDTFKPSEFNLFRRTDLSSLALQMEEEATGVLQVDLGQPMIASWSKVAGTDWTLIAMANRASLLAETYSLRTTLWQINQIMLVGLVIFYLGFFAVLRRRSSQMSEVMSRPLADLEERMMRIAGGETALPLQRSDVMEVQRANDHLMKMAAQLDAAARSKAAFLSAVSHELRTPLNAIVGHSQLLRLSAGKPLDSDRMRHVDGMAKAGRDLLSIVEQVIDMSAIERGQVADSMRNVLLAPLLAQAIDDQRAEAQKNNVTIKADVPQHALSVWTDPGLLSRIVGHILGNAVRYNRPDGSVSIEVRHNHADWLELVIADTGYGIATDVQDRLFEPFDRLGRENGVISGIGLGLTISQRLAAVLGCSLTFTSDEDRGTVFVLRIPKAKASLA